MNSRIAKYAAEAHATAVDDRNDDVDVLSIGGIAAAAQFAEQRHRAIDVFSLGSVLAHQEPWARAVDPFKSALLGLSEAATLASASFDRFSGMRDLLAPAFREGSVLASMSHERWQGRELVEAFRLGQHPAFEAGDTIGSLAATAALPHRMLAERMSAFDSPGLHALQCAVLGVCAKEFRWGTEHILATPLGIDSMIGGAFARAGTAARVFEKFLPVSTHEHWSSHWKDTMLPALSLLARESHQPSGILMELPDPQLGASLSWLTRRGDEPRISRAALSGEASGELAAEVVIECDPECSICGGPLVSFKSEIKWLGPKLGLRNRRIFPSCSRCAQKELEDPGFLQRSLPSPKGPSLGVRREVIKGGNKGDGRPAARLRIVRND